MRTKDVAVAVVMTTSTIVASSTQKQSPIVWIERVGGAWEVREHGRAPRPIALRQDAIPAGAQVRCVKLPCTIAYSTDAGPKPLFPKSPELKRWVPVPTPSEPPVAPMPAELQQLLGRIGRRGGADKAVVQTMCPGDLPLRAPGCLEAIAATDFALEWNVDPEDVGKVYALSIGPTDSNDRRRWNNLDSQAGGFQAPALQAYLTGLQQDTRAVDVTLRLMRTEIHSATRIVHLLSSADENEHRQALTRLETLPELPRHVGYLQQFLKMGMWSKAAAVARTLLEAAPSSVEIQKYALIGFCGSEFVEEAAKLRGALLNAGVKGICDSDDGGANQ